MKVPSDTRATSTQVRWLAPLLALLLAPALASCTAPILANEVPATRPPATPGPTPQLPADPIPVELPRDDGPHDRLTEWWYYTGHLAAEDGRRFGFQLVIFRAERGRFPVAWASHLALTDEAGSRFLYDQRAEVGPEVDRSQPGRGFDLAISGDILPGVRGRAEPWRLAGASGRDRLEAPGGRARDGTAFGLGLDLDDGGRPAVLHDHDGYVEFGPAGGSYYYSRTRMEATGTVTLDGEDIPVTGSAWFDHQWGDFIAVGGGGWDWFAVNLDDGTDLTLSLVRDADGAYPLRYGTLVEADGSVRHVEAEAFSVDVTAEWTSALTGATWPAGWSIELPGDELIIELAPTLADQELDTRPTTGVVYWEGSQVVRASRAGRALGGEAYVELTGYGPGLIGSGMGEQPGTDRDES
jgi:predicted secreted hydrolase